MRHTSGRSSYIPQRISGKRLGHAPVLFATRLTTTRVGRVPLIAANERRLKWAALGSSSAGPSGHGDASQIRWTEWPRFSQPIASATLSGILESRQHLPHWVHLKCISTPASSSILKLPAEYPWSEFARQYRRRR